MRGECKCAGCSDIRKIGVDNVHDYTKKLGDLDGTIAKKALMFYHKHNRQDSIKGEGT